LVKKIHTSACPQIENHLQIESWYQKNLKNSSEHLSPNPYMRLVAVSTLPKQKKKKKKKKGIFTDKTKRKSLIKKIKK
jgi:hypothetical protein